MTQRSPLHHVRGLRSGHALRVAALLVVAAGLALSFAAAPAAAQAPVVPTPVVKQLPFKFKAPGSLAGRNVAFTFQLWDDSALEAGSLLWEEAKTIRVPSNLTITHLLGSVVPFDDPDQISHGLPPVDFGRQLWVEVRRGAILVGRGRAQLGPVVPYALWSAASETAAGGGAITGVEANDGLTGGGSAGSVPLAVGAGTGISVGADAVSVDTAVIQRRVGSSCASGQAIRAIAADGTVTCETPAGANHDATYVNVTGDTMTGALTLPANGLTAGTSQLVLSGGRVGVGTNTPQELLEVAGTVRLPTAALIRSSASRFVHNTGTRNFFAGTLAGSAATISGTNNTGLGYQALYQVNGGSTNTAVGQAALAVLVSGSDNTAVGNRALMENTASGNTAVGSSALSQNSTGDGNTAVGSGALQANSDGQYSVAVGTEALAGNGTGGANVAVGYRALMVNSVGANNTAVGYKALSASTTTGNTAVGSGALQKSAGGYDNTAVGAGALANTEGYTAAYPGSVHGGFNNTAVGARALASLAPFEPGAGDDGQENTAVGVGAMAALTSGGNNVALGVGALASSDGVGNAAIGYKALENNIGSSNVAVGDHAGQSAAGDAGYNNTYLGAVARPTVNDLNNATAIGYNATVGANNSLTLGSSTVGERVNVGIATATPTARLHVKAGDIFLDTTAVGQGIVLRATDNPSVCKRITINAAGVFAAATVACP